MQLQRIKWKMGKQKRGKGEWERKTERIHLIVSISIEVAIYFL